MEGDTEAAQELPHILRIALDSSPKGDPDRKGRVTPFRPDATHREERVVAGDLRAMERSDQIFVWRPDLVVTTLEREAVVLDLNTKYFFSINASGWAIAQLFEQGASPADAVQACHAGAAPPSLDPEIHAFIAQLVEEGLIEPGQSLGDTPQVVFEGPWEHPAIEKHKEPLQQVMISAFDPTLPLAE